MIEPKHQRFVMGSDGTDYWLARQLGSVWVTNDFRALVPELQSKIPNKPLLEFVASPDEPLFMEMSALLAHIESRYEVQLVASPDDAEYHVRATQQAGATSRSD